MPSVGDSLSRVGQAYLLASSGLMALGALVHLAAVAMGSNVYALLGAPAGLVAMVGTGSSRPALSCFGMAAVRSVGDLRAVPGSECVRAPDVGSLSLCRRGLCSWRFSAHAWQSVQG